ncbi:MAG: polyphosphate polymerase domain-containing protein [Candidatus Faecousia sp.]|nr:polyphosphate polymerase domain-containing protein [Bacillota bacterium]MDY4755983.1 polyphosphate polymerase domain-containing protein [Candidatus Faecousia sp.]MDY6159249.1 polyphosphate polymerase domain-containing protein [Candidatus Faecousia sp.]
MENQMIFKRYELKYLVTKEQRDEILWAMEPYMTADRFFHSSIRNIYCDTPNYRLIRQSLDKPVYKEKLRLRSYGPAGMGDEIFVELKKKYESVVYKQRLEMPQKQALEALMGKAPLPDSQIGREIDAALQFYQELIPRVFLSYERDAYHAWDSDFRLTFDDCIRYRTQALTLDSDPWGEALLDGDTVLMELKIPDSMPLWMASLLSRLGIVKASFSKYGAAYQQILLNQQKGILRYA